MLNAFRHQRFNTLQSPRSPQYQASAQRLSASEIQHGKQSGDRSPQTKCSTPFGIRDSTQTIQYGAHLHSRVLNAFRHQRFNTKYADSLGREISSVLNAFRHQRFNTQYPQELVLWFDVLNAFRHQRFNTLSCAI